MSGEVRERPRRGCAPTAAAPSYSVRRCSRSSVQYAPGSFSYGMPTLPELITRLPAIAALELHVRVAADDDVGVDAGEDLREPLLRRALGEDVDVVPRRRMAEQHAVDLRASAAARRETRSARRSALRASRRAVRPVRGRARPASAPDRRCRESRRRGRRAPRSRSSVSDGCGPPATTSPPTTIVASSGISASTASSAGRFPCTS